MFSGVNIKLIFAVLSIIVGLVAGTLPYLRDMFRGQTQPHAYTWLIWSITQGTAVAGLWHGKGGWGVLPLLVGTVTTFLVFLLSLKLGTRNITKGDTVILIAALLAIAVWWRLHDPVLSVLMVSVIDVVGYFPSFRKTFQEPWSETPFSWFIFALVNLFAIAALSAYNFLTVFYIVSITTANLTLLAICLLRRKIVPQHSQKTV